MQEPRQAFVLPVTLNSLCKPCKWWLGNIFWGLALCRAVVAHGALPAGASQSPKNRAASKRLYKVQPSIPLVVERVLPGVVSIRTRDITNSDLAENSNIASVPRMQTANKTDEFLDEFLLVGKKKSLTKGYSQGSGFFFKDASFIVTNFHVVKNAKRIEVLSHGDRAYRLAKLVGFSAKHDLAVIKVAFSSSQRNLQWGNSASAKLGEEVFSIGNPFGFGHSVSRGIISGKNRAIGHGVLEDYLQTDAALNPGNSGGPLINTRGEVLGVNTAVLGEAQGISFAIPSEIVKKVTADILRGSSVSYEGSKAFLGIVISEKTDLKENSGEKISRILMVENIAKNSPAANQGMEIGDRIFKINGLVVKDKIEFVSIFNELLPGDTLEVVVIRNNKFVDLNFSVTSAKVKSAIFNIPGIF